LVGGCWQDTYFTSFKAILSLQFIYLFIIFNTETLVNQLATPSLSRFKWEAFELRNGAQFCFVPIDHHLWMINLFAMGG